MPTTRIMTNGGVDNHDKENPPRGGKIREEGQGEEEGLASAKVVHRTAVQVDDGIAAFLLMAEATVASGAIVVGSGDNDNHSWIVVAATMPRTTTMTMSWLGSWWGPNNGNNVVAPVIDSGNF
jgi:hypothetical protein